MQRLAKPRNEISTKIQVFLNPQKLIPTKINKSTVIVNSETSQRQLLDKNVSIIHACPTPTIISDVPVKLWSKLLIWQ